jgi:hypothetical protein
MNIDMGKIIVLALSVAGGMLLYTASANIVSWL